MGLKSLRLNPEWTKNTITRRSFAFLMKSLDNRYLSFRISEETWFSKYLANCVILTLCSQESFLIFGFAWIWHSRYRSSPSFISSLDNVDPSWIFTKGGSGWEIEAFPQNVLWEKFCQNCLNETFHDIRYKRNFSSMLKNDFIEIRMNSSFGILFCIMETSCLGFQLEPQLGIPVHCSSQRENIKKCFAM